MLCIIIHRCHGVVSILSALGGALGAIGVHSAFGVLGYRPWIGLVYSVHVLGCACCSVTESLCLVA